MACIETVLILFRYAFDHWFDESNHFFWGLLARTASPVSSESTSTRWWLL